MGGNSGMSKSKDSKEGSRSNESELGIDYLKEIYQQAGQRRIENESEYKVYKEGLDNLVEELKIIEKKCKESQYLPQIGIGSKLQGYKLIERLGGGTFGEVFLGKNASEEEVAIKVLHSNEDVDGFLKEIVSMAALDHPNIVPLLGYGRRGKVPFLVMEHMSGGTLADKIKKNNDNGIKGIPLEQIAECMEGAGNGLAELHESDVVHRDVKSSNLLLEKNGVVRVGDLGFVAPVGTEEEIVGTPLYMPPELMKGEACCPETDMYGLGITALELFFGEEPQKRMENDQSQSAQIVDWKEKHKSLKQICDDKDLKYGYLNKKTS